MSTIIDIKNLIFYYRVCQKKDIPTNVFTEFPK